MYLDLNTQNYYEAWCAVKEAAADALQAELRPINERLWNMAAKTEAKLLGFNLDGVLSLHSLPPEKAYECATEIALMIGQSMKSHFSRLTTDVWLLLGRRHLTCELFEGRQEYFSSDALLLMHSEQQITSAVALFAAEGRTILPDEPGPYPIPVDQGTLTTIHVARQLCRAYEEALIARRRLLYGGFLEIGPGGLRTKLPPDTEARVELLRKGTRRGARILSRAGAYVPFAAAPAPASSQASYQRFLMYAGIKPSEDWQFPDISNVLPFGLRWVDAQEILPALRLFDEEVREEWRMSAVEILACAVIASQTVFASTEGSTEVVVYAGEARAVYSMEESVIRSHLSQRLVTVCEELGEPISSERAAQSQAAAMDVLTARGGATGKAMEHDDRLPMLTWVPFLFRAGDKLLLDCLSMPLAVSSVVNRLRFHSDRGQKKGKTFEQQVSAHLLRSVENLSAVPAMERRFFDERREVGEADVVVLKEDTAFLIECKSRRNRNIDHCMTFEEATSQMRDALEWARQARRTAEFLAKTPKGRKHAVPETVRWIVAIVCSVNQVFVLEDNPELFLVRDEVPIVLTLEEIEEFLASGRWRDREVVTQFEVTHIRTRLQKAKELLQAGRLQDAVAVYREVLDQEPGCAEAYDQLGWALIESDRITEGMEMLRRGLAVEPSAALWNHLGVANSYAENYDAAIEAYHRAEQLGGVDAQLLVHLANSLDAKGDTEEAIRVYEKALRLDGSNPAAFYNLGVALFGQEKYARAKEVFERAIELDKEYVAAHFNLGVIFLNEGKSDKAQSSFERALRLEAGDMRVMLGLSDALAQQDKLAESLHVEGLIHAGNGDVQRAMSAWAKSLEIEPTPDTLRAVGRVFAEAGDLSEAISYFEAAVTKKPGDVDALCDLGHALSDQGRLEEARKQLQLAVASPVDSTRTKRALAATLNNLGVEFARAGKLEEALDAYSQAVQLVPDYAMGHYSLGLAYQRKGDLDLAEASYKRALEANPKYLEAMSNLGSVLGHQGKTDEAIRILLRALWIAPTDVVSLRNLAALYRSSGWLVQAAAMYKRAVETMENSSDQASLTDVVPQYADLLRLIGRNDDAATLELRLRSREPFPE